MSSENIELKPCIECALTIPQAAKLCSHCDTYQDKRRFLHLSNTTLALLTALVSVLGVAAPAIYKAIHKPTSEAAIVDMAVDGTRLRVTAMNWGDAPAILGSVVVASDYLAPATKIRLRNDEQAVLKPGTNLLAFDVVPLLDEGQSYSGSLDAMTRMLTKQKEESEVLFETMQSNGTRDIYRLRLTNSDLFEILRANANRCSAIDKANFENGCIGPGEEKHGRYEVSGPRLNDKNEIID